MKTQKKKGLWAKLLEKMDKKLEQKASTSSSSCCGGSSNKKGSSCCS